MPYVRVQTNVELDAAGQRTLLERISSGMADALGKPERYVMVALEPAAPMLFAGSDEPAAYLELKSIGLAENETSELSGRLCAIMSETLGVNADRVYIEFVAAPRRMWGWNGTTF